MPGGIDIHAHVCASSTTLARRLLPEEHMAEPVEKPDLTDGSIPRSGSGGTVPTTFTTGYRYAALGYTTVFDAAVAAVTARTTHAQFDDTPIVDGGFFVLMGNDDYLLRQIAAGEAGRHKVGANGEAAVWGGGAGGGRRFQKKTTAVGLVMGFCEV